MTTTLIEIGALDRARPSLSASPVELADWYEQKAVVLHRIADTSDAAEHDMYQRWADQAHAHAMRLLAGVGGGSA